VSIDEDVIFLLSYIKQHHISVVFIPERRKMYRKKVVRFPLSFMVWKVILPSPFSENTHKDSQLTKKRMKQNEDKKKEKMWVRL